MPLPQEDPSDLDIRSAMGAREDRRCGFQPFFLLVFRCEAAAVSASLYGWGVEEIGKNAGNFWLKLIKEKKKRERQIPEMSNSTWYRVAKCLLINTVCIE